MTCPSRVNSRTLPAALVLALALAGPVFAQGVGINATGAAADTSAILDLAATNKGFLPPRMTAVQRGAIVLPATGLLVYQSDGAQGLYWNAGTPSVPNWKQVGESGAGASQWVTSGSNVYYAAGNVGIKRTSPQATLDVLGGNWDVVNGEGDLRIGDATYRLKVGIATGGGGAGAATIMQQGPAGAYNVLALGTQGNKVLYVNGATQRVGIGTDAPNAPLSFPPVLGKKITLYPGVTGDVGFAVAGNRLQIYADHSGADVAVGWDAAGTFNERFAFKPTGALAVSGNSGTAGQVLQSNGAGAAAAWVSPANSSYPNTYFVESTALTTVTADALPMDLPGMLVTFTIPGNAKLVVSASAYVVGMGCTNCATARPELRILVDGFPVHSSVTNLAQGEAVTVSATAYRTRTAGTHTVKLAGYSQVQDARFGLAATDKTTQLIVQVIPE